MTEAESSGSPAGDTETGAPGQDAQHRIDAGAARVRAALNRHPIWGGVLGLGVVGTVIGIFGLPEALLVGGGGYVAYRLFRRPRNEARPNVAQGEEIA